MTRTMRKIKSTLLIYLLSLLSLSIQARTEPPRLIVRGDDMGFTHSGNDALIKSYREGIETSIEVIVPSPWFPEAVKLLADNPKIDVGIHLALTSEWDNLKWRPLTDGPSLRDANGYFYPKVYPDKNYPGQSLMATHLWLRLRSTTLLIKTKCTLNEASLCASFNWSEHKSPNCQFSALTQII